jgi:hypothetical protein
MTVAIKMVALAQQNVAGRRVYPGHPFEVASEIDADALEASGLARREMGAYHRREMVAEQQTRGARDSRHQYRRSDMKVRE